MNHSYHEIFQQYKSLRETYDYILSQREALLQFFNSNAPEEIVFVACGSSYWGSLSAAVTMESKLGIKCYTVASGEVLLNPDFYRKSYRKPLIVAPSRSGSTSETIEAIALMKNVYQAPVLSIVEYENSPLAQLSDLSLFLPWCNEVSVCQTRSFSSLYLTQFIIASIWSNDDSLFRESDRYIQECVEIIRTNEGRLKRIAEKPWDHVVALGNGGLFGLACEGALIMLEMAQVPVSFYNTLELRHGPMVNVNSKTLVVMFSSGGNGTRLEEELSLDCLAKGAGVIAIGKEGTFQQAVDLFSLEQGAAAEIIGLYGSFVMQGLAYYKALQVGVNPDSPQGLSPWIQLSPTTL
ncbi:SIS domain-containing protein [Paenibacillus eucommiae]|uniref:Fructoselysine-6-P-deglycase FrlB-like protein n=1 Tax=Paenibacillus eucommiae TaxID=1355755 RepID=A0ABS4ISD2_9BACL|nr:SIS domain-containing protein [Paenibacillus eucommiae]MBP1989926.1 fructoselysine-6-P-deglycase FrlB-like protein [Paenibacillus eucommiae]